MTAFSERTLSELEAEKRSLEDRLTALTAAIDALRVYRRLAGFDTPDAPKPLERATERQKRPLRPREGTAMEATENVAIQLLDLLDRPISTADVIEELKRTGGPIPDHNTSNVISARLSNSTKIVGRRGFGWWYADRPWPGEELLVKILGELKENEPPALPKAMPPMPDFEEDDDIG